jgi:two-component system NarL family response regulator
MSQESPSAENPIRCLVADDHAIVREGVAATIELYDEMRVVARAANGREAVALFREHRPDVTLMDLNMPEIGGVEAITAIRDEFPDARIIILTTYDGDEDIFRGLRAGAKAYLLKEGSVEQLVETIRAVHRGQVRIPQEVAAKLAQRMTSPELTAREMEVLRLIVAGNSNAEIGAALFITEATVKAHVNSILGKLDVSDRTQAVTTALKRGIVHLDRSE